MKTAFVTGGANGLGAAICARAAQDGYRVAVVDMDGDKARETAAKIGNAVGIQADVTDEAQMERALDEFGVIPDLLVNNAGIVRFGPLIEQSVADFRKVVEVNLVGVYITTRAVARRMVTRGSGNIVSITSINALTPGPGAGAYPAAKAGVAKMTEHLALELGPLGIRVNCVAPGFIDGGMSAPIYADPKIRAIRGGGVPFKKELGTPEQIADAVLFLASEQAHYIHGHQLVVDGGVVPSVLAQLPRA